jgi:hypothetical protein
MLSVAFFIVILKVIMLIVNMLSVVILSVVMLCVVAPFGKGSIIIWIFYKKFHSEAL